MEAAPFALKLRMLKAEVVETVMVRPWKAGNYLRNR